MLIIYRCIIILYYVLKGVDLKFCKWDLTLTAEETKKRNCGYICPDPWDQTDRHYCGSPSPCCCQPVCDYKKAQQETFLGINWSDQFSHQIMPRAHQFQILKNNGFKHIKTFTIDGIADIAAVYGNRRGDVFVYAGIANKLIPNMIDPEQAFKYVQKFILPYANIISMILVGNEPFLCLGTEEWAKRSECGRLEIPSKVLPAALNFRKALEHYNLTHIKISSPLNGGVLNMAVNPWTSCSSDFRQEMKSLLHPILDFMKKYEYPVIVNLYPWFAVTSGAIPIPTAIGTGENFVSDGSFSYPSNFDVQLDMMRIALCKNNAGELEVMIGETGWPSDGSPYASKDISKKYLDNIIKRSKGELIRDTVMDQSRFTGLPTSIFIFEAFDENKKAFRQYLEPFENSFGLFTESGIPKWIDEHGMLDLDIKGKNKIFEKYTKSPSELQSRFHI